MIYSNPIPSQWMTHNLEKDYITDILLRRKVLSPMSCQPDWVSGTVEEKPPRAFGLIEGENTGEIET